MELDTPIRLGDLTRAQLQVELKEQRSRAFTRWVSCLIDAGIPDAASRLYLERYPGTWGASDVQKSLTSLECKAGVAPGSTSGVDWAKPLTGVTALASGFAAVARSASLLGRLPGVVQVPFRTSISTETQSPSFQWIGEGAPKPVSRFSFSTGVTLEMLKAMGIIVLTSELARLTSPGADLALRNALVSALVGFQDASLLSPTSTAIAGVRPASLTAGLTPVTPVGALATDVAALLSAFYASRPGASENSVLIAGPAKGYAMRALNGGGGPGLPVVISEAAGSTIIALDAGALYVADDGVRLDISREASLQMDSAPMAVPDATVVPVSLWQLNLVGIKTERFLNWFLVPGAAQYLA